ncbi:hypothetical protein EC988_005725, partial [Linderina pennispora]
VIGTGVEAGLDYAVNNQRSRKGGRRRRISDRTKDFLGDLGVELIGTGVGAGLDAAIYNNQRGISYTNLKRPFPVSWGSDSIDDPRFAVQEYY